MIHIGLEISFYSFPQRKKKKEGKNEEGKKSEFAIVATFSYMSRVLSFHVTFFFSLFPQRKGEGEKRRGRKKQVERRKKRGARCSNTASNPWMFILAKYTCVIIPNFNQQID